MSRPDVVVDWCSYEAAKYAVEHWHYSKRMLAGKYMSIGIWENRLFIGAIVFSHGANKAIGKQYGLSLFLACELSRVAMTKHAIFVSHLIAKSLSMLKSQADRLRLVVSYADQREGHIGAIYQASNWIYVGQSSGNDRRNCPYLKPGGGIVQWRTMSKICQRHGMSHTLQAAISLGYTPLGFMPKHKYLYPLDKAMRRQIEPLAQPYPKREHAGEVHDGA